MPLNPILSPGTAGMGNEGPPQPRRSYDPILQKYPDEMEPKEEHKRHENEEERRRSVAVLQVRERNATS